MVERKNISDMSLVEVEEYYVALLESFIMDTEARVDRVLNKYHRGRVTVKALTETNLLLDLTKLLNPLLLLGKIQKIVKRIIELSVDSVEIDLNVNITDFDRNYVDYMSNMNFELVKGMTDDLAGKLNDSLNTGWRSGEGIQELKARVKEIYGNGNITSARAESIARTETMRAWNGGRIQAAKDSGVRAVKRWNAHFDARTGSDSKKLDGQVRGLDDDFFDEVNKKYVFQAPNRPNCYDKDTEIYTEFGWKYIKDVEFGESVLSLNPDDFNLNWQNVCGTTKYEADKMIHFKNKTFDLMVTPDHNMPFIKRWDRRGNRLVMNFCKAKDLPTEANFYRSSKWVGIKSYDVHVGGQVVDLHLFSEFMAWFLSEGSVSLRKGREQVSITQSIDKNLDNYERIAELCKSMGFKIWCGKDKIYINNKSLAEYCNNFGKCDKKYVPIMIKNAEISVIECFLAAYCRGDGSQKEPHIWNSQVYNDNRTYFTSSKRMADDLGELILKVGHRPSYFLSGAKGKVTTHNNGVYESNFDVIGIRECISQFATLDNKHLSSKLIDYNDMVYCVEIPEQHTLLVRRNGKVTWCGNCRCRVDIVPVGDDFVFA